MRIWKCAMTLSALGAMALAGQAHGAITIGQTFVPDAANEANPCVGNTTYLQTASAPIRYAAPSAGVITAWSYQTNSSPPTGVKFKVGRVVSGNTYRIVGESTLKAPAASTLNTYTDIGITVQAGDVIGFYVPAGNTDCAAEVTGYDIGYAFESDAPLGLDTAFDVETERQLDVSARLEPDCDGDGLGDETQDTDTASCADPPGPNPPVTDPPDTARPETTITKDAPKRIDTGKVKFRFESDEAGATFECKLKGKDLKPRIKQFNDCDSPRKYKNLDPGRYGFKVRATDAAGNVDLTPAGARFRVLD